MTSKSWTWSVGEVLGKLQGLGLAENSLGLFTSDQGPRETTAWRYAVDRILGANIFRRIALELISQLAARSQKRIPPNPYSNFLNFSRNPGPY